METNISNLVGYNSSMAKSMIDKMFFMDKIDDDIHFVVDYGCADGALINFLAQLFPQMTFVGYDKNLSMIDAARLKNQDNKNTIFFDSLGSFSTWTHNNENFHIENAALNLSSIIHEVYSYSTVDEVNDFWNFVTSCGFQYIIIRDMCLDETAHRTSLKEDLIKVRSKYDKNKIQEFEHYNGSINDNYNLIHFLLKYRYTENWKREVRENYLPCPIETIAAKVGSRYELIYFDHYVLPFIARTVKKDFDITIKDYTHVKFIFQFKN